MLFVFTALATRDRMLEHEFFSVTESGRPFLGRADLLTPNLSSPSSSLETQMLEMSLTHLLRILMLPKKEDGVTRDKILLTDKDTPTSGEQMPPWLTYFTKTAELNFWVSFTGKRKKLSYLDIYAETSTLLHGGPLQ